MHPITKLNLQILTVVMTVAAGPAWAGAAAPLDRTSLVVRYADLDLRSEAGVAALEHRIGKAADKVCGPVDSRSLAESGLRDACRAKAIADASPQVDSVVAMARATTRYAMNLPEGLSVRAR